jgi:hypothetical protein
VRAMNGMVACSQETSKPAYREGTASQARTWRSVAIALDHALHWSLTMRCSCQLTFPVDVNFG